MASDSPALVIVTPTRGRAERLADLAQRFANTTPAHRMLFVVDPDDLESELAAARAGDVLKTDDRYGYPRKINEGIRHTTEPLILCGSDDLNPHPGWFEAASALISEEVGFVAVNDLGGAAELGYSVSPLVSRAYAELGTIDGQDGLYWEGYWHNPCDTEAAATAKARGAFVFCPDAVIEHLHPNYGKAEVDQTYLEGGLNHEAARWDGRAYRRRKKLWG